MKRIEWENYQDGDSTPLNAENLNLMQDNIEEALELKADKKDGEWTDITLSSGIKIGSLGQKPQYRKVGNKVEIRGDIEVTASSSAIIIATFLPADIWPKTNQYITTSLASTRIARLGVSKTGSLFINWIYGLDGVQVISGTIGWLQLNMYYYI